MIAAFNSRFLGFAKGAAKTLRTVKSANATGTNTASACWQATTVVTQEVATTQPTSVFSHFLHRVWSNVISQRICCVNSVAADVRRKVWGQFMSTNGSKFSMLAFAGFCLMEEQEQVEEKVSIGNLFEYVSSNIDQFWKHDSGSNGFPSAFSEYEIGDRLGKPSSNAAVYSAKYDGCEVALKIMFNYSVPSNAAAISEAFRQEYSVLPSAQMTENDKEEEVILPDHPFIIKLHGKFVDKTPLLHDAVDTYPVAVPRSLHAGGHGRNKTMCLVMPKYACSLREYLAKETLTSEQCLSVFRQLLEGVAHLERNSIAHRDLKSDNLLINLRDDGGIQVAITDFGCCLAEGDMLLPYTTRYTDRGGNFALLAPEIATAIPQEGLYLDYSVADAWACGAIAHEIFTGENPFYSCLSNVEYADEDIKGKPLNSEWKLVDTVVSRLLQRDPDHRISAGSAASIIFLLVNAPSEWLCFPRLIRGEAVETWLLAFSLCTLDKCRRYGDTRFIPPNLLSDLVFLHRITPGDVLDMLSLIDELLCQ